MQKESIYGLTREACGLVLAHGEKKFRATQVWEWLYTKRVVHLVKCRTFLNH